MLPSAPRGNLAGGPHAQPPAAGATSEPVSADKQALQTLFGGKGLSRLSLQEIEKTMIDHCLAEVKGNVSEAARRLGLTRAQLSYRLSRRPADK